MVPWLAAQTTSASRILPPYFENLKRTDMNIALPTPFLAFSLLLFHPILCYVRLEFEQIRARV